jgi:hypothetical protein
MKLKYISGYSHKGLLEFDDYSEYNNEENLRQKLSRCLKDFKLFMIKKL